MMHSKTPRFERGIGVVPVLVMVILAVGLFGLYQYANSTRNEVIGQEQALGAQYLDNQNYLSKYISGFYEQVGLANLKSEKMDQILSDAVKGRYNGKEGGGLDGSALVSAIVEAYPDTSGLDIIDKIIPYVQSNREGYANLQTKLLDMLKSYEIFCKKDILRSFILQNFVPSQNLVARVGTKKYEGKEALDKMYQIVLASDAVKAYDTGVMDPLQVPGSTPPAKK